MNSMISSYRFLCLTLLLAAFSIASTGVRGADEHAHDAVHGKLMLNDGQKWTTDAPLRLAMSRIGKAVGAKLPAIHEDTFATAEYAAPGKAVDGEVVYMINNCKLPSDADAVLHLVLADIMQGSAAMQGKTAETKPRTGAVKIVQTLHSYGRYFDHPGCQPPTH